MRTIHEEAKKSSVRTATAKAEEIVCSERVILTPQAKFMMAKVKESVFRPMAYITTKVIHQLYSSIHYQASDLHRVNFTGLFTYSQLHETAKRAENEGVSIVFLPTHKCKVAVGFISFPSTYRLRSVGTPVVPLQHIAAVHRRYVEHETSIHCPAGDNLDIPLLGSLFHNCGAFYISRPFPNDPLYKAIFNEYIAQLLVSVKSVSIRLTLSVVVTI
jgi:glycerol-3-phosphate O-acyltransferase